MASTPSTSTAGISDSATFPGPLHGHSGGEGQLPAGAGARRRPQPLRADMVNDAGDWPWSSYVMTTRRQRAPVWVETDWLLGQFGHGRRAAVAATRDFVCAGVDQDNLWSDLRQQVFLGSADFLERLLQQLLDADLREVPRRQLRGPVRSVAEYATTAKRDEAMAAA